MSSDLARMRLEYEAVGLNEADVAADPFTQFGRWFDDAVRAELFEPNAMVVSTVDGDGQPTSRLLLLKGYSEAGFDFYTNYRSNKSADLTAHPKAACTFAWLGLHRQVNIAGSVERVSEVESDEYWAQRTRGSQLGAWASAQSSVLDDRQQLLDAYAEVERRYPEDVPRPPHWGGWRVVPAMVEFWQGRENRLHDRLRFCRQDGGAWSIVRLSP